LQHPGKRITLRPETAKRVWDAVKRSGTDPEQYILDALDAYLSKLPKETAPAET
jgi:hypothetical protein